MTNRYSIVLGGIFGVGKTSLFRRLKLNVFSEDACDMGLENLLYQTTLSSGKNVEVCLWDTGGLERYYTITANYYRSCQAIILVYDLNDEQTLYALREWISQAVEYSTFKSSILLSLWGNKSDAVDPEVNFSAAVRGFMEQNDIKESLHFKVSAKNGTNVKKAFDAVIEMLDRQYESHPFPNDQKPHDSTCKKTVCCG